MNNASEARCLLRAHRYGALSTISKKLAGAPFGSIAPYVVDHDGSLIIQISDMAEHTKNIAHDMRVSLITHNQNDSRIQMQGRVTFVGNAHRLAEPQHARYLRHFPEAADLLQLDFAFYRIEPVAIRYIGGIGRIHWVKPENYRVAQAVLFAAQETNLIPLLNLPDTLRTLSMQSSIDMPDANLFAIDCDGISIRSGDKIFRLAFNDTLTEPPQIASLHSLQFQTKQG